MLEPGLRVGSYRIIGPLGEGAMGAVFEAVHEEIERRVAIKILRPELARRPDVAARFVNEARAVNIIDHPGVVAISDYGQLPDGAPFIVMELLRGEPLRARLQRERGLPLDEARRLGWQMAMALSAAHGKGIIHRDLKPANVMLVPDPTYHGGVRVKVLDFGIAKLAPEQRAGDGAMQTAAGSILGTPAYIAPEQCRAEPTVGDRADVYALGVILYEMLAGRRPFTGGEAEVLGKHLYQAPPPILQARPSLPEELAELVHAMLHKEPEARPSMVDVAARLEPVAAEEPALASTAPGDRGAAPSAASQEAPSTLSEAAGAVAPGAPRRIGRLLVAAAPAALILAAGLAWRAGLLRRPAPPVEPARAQGAQAPQGGEAERLAEPRLGLGVLRDFHDGSGAARTALAAPDVWDSAAADFARVAGKASPESIPLRWRSGRALCEGRAALLRAQMGPALQAIRTAVQLEPDWAPAHAVLAHALSRSGDAEGAAAEIDRAEALEPSWWVPKAARAIQHAQKGNLDAAIQAFRRGLVLAPEEPSLLDGLAMALHGARLDSEAEEVAARALELDPDVVWSRVVRAERALDRGDGKAALSEAEGALSRDPRNPAARLARADALSLLGRRAEARQQYEAFTEVVGKTGALGLVEGRAEAVRQALADGTLPAPRGKGKARR